MFFQESITWCFNCKISFKYIFLKLSVNVLINAKRKYIHNPLISSLWVNGCTIDNLNTFKLIIFLRKDQNQVLYQSNFNLVYLICQILEMLFSVSAFLGCWHCCDCLFLRPVKGESHSWVGSAGIQPQSTSTKHVGDLVLSVRLFWSELSFNGVHEVQELKNLIFSVIALLKSLSMYQVIK